VSEAIIIVDIAGLKDYFNCPKCGEFLTIPPRTQESLNHIKEIQPFQEWRRELGKKKPELIAFENPRVIICNRCDQPLTCLDEFSEIVGNVPKDFIIKGTQEDITKWIPPPVAEEFQDIWGKDLLMRYYRQIALTVYRTICRLREVERFKKLESEGQQK
jgi:hypothetical protein